MVASTGSFGSSEVPHMRHQCWEARCGHAVATVAASGATWKLPSPSTRSQKHHPDVKLGCETELANDAPLTPLSLPPACYSGNRSSHFTSEVQPELVSILL